MKNIMSGIGILIVMVGTILSFYKFITSKSNYMGTAEQKDNTSTDFEKEKRWVFVGCILISLGSCIQIASLWIF